MVMKKISVAAILFAFIFAILAPQAASASTTVSVSYFHDTLAPYGRWVVVARYGEVWVPAGVSRSWDPYWDGEWLWTDYGWTWVSYDPWGDIPYHYGTWAWVDPYGWVWVPGTIWAPAWVTWAWTDRYIGWAPVPVTFVLSSSGYVGSPIVVAATRYVFVPATQFVGVNVSTVRVAESLNTTILPQARKATRFAVSGGIVRTTANPPLDFVQRVSRKRVERSGTGRLKAPPTTLAAARVSGKSFRVIAPASERTTRASSPRDIERSRPSAAAQRSKAQAPAKQKRAPAGRVKAQAPTEKKRAHAPAPSRRPEAVSQPRKTIRGGSAARAPRQKGVARSSSRSDYRPAPAVPRREAAPRPVAPPQVSRPDSHESAHGAGKKPAVKPQPQPKGASAGPPPKQKGKGRG
jgi:hypothetical protein